MWHINPLVILQEENGEGILFHPQTLHTLWLNETSVLLWKKISDGLTADEIGAYMTAQFDLPSDADAVNDVRQFIHALTDIEFIRPVTAT